MIKLFFKFPSGTLVTAALYLVATSVGDIQTDSLPPDSITEYLDEKSSYYSLPKLLELAKELEFKQNGITTNQKMSKFLQLLSSNAVTNHHGDIARRNNIKKRKFSEVDSRGFDSDIFDEGFGEWSPMKRWGS
ncbi:uncharacterized protein [Parasteatoda tepidariorum]|uniref:uncharacterized protein isoform X2 n=1 Tax=Parasteatoda tepidariorum TaxID=114398 RepID=UPI001C72579D|nr:uncharacterized protein LOC107450130 isoform X2 [Parasteatoda tepidariorum]